MPFHSFITDSGGWSTVSDETAFANAHLEIHSVRVTSPTRQTPFPWTVCHRKAAVVVAPQTADGRFVLIRQERVPIRATIWEFPAGQIDHATDQDAGAIRATGLRELKEESGYQLSAKGEVIPLGHFFPSCGFTDEHCHLLLARPVELSPEGQQLDANEAITATRLVTAEELQAMIAANEICDSNTLAAFARLTALGLTKRPI